MSKIKLTAMILAAIFIFSIIPISADNSGDYGMGVIKNAFYYVYSEETGELDLKFVFYLNALKGYDVYYSAAIYNSDNDTITTWNEKKVSAGTENYEYSFRMSRCELKMTEGISYKIRVTGKVNINGTTKSFYWDYQFANYPSLYYWKSSDFGMSVKYQFEDFNAGNLTYKLTLAANSIFDVRYSVKLLNTAGETCYTWNDVTIPAETGGLTYTYKTTNVPVILPGAYTYIIYGTTNFGEIQYSYRWSIVYNLSNDLSAKG